jgi:hypothetical protein
MNGRTILKWTIKIWFEDVDWIPEHGRMAGFCEYGNQLSDC